MSSFIPGRSYRYRRAFKGPGRTNLRVGDVYRFHKQEDFFPVTRKEFVLFNSLGEEFDLSASYEALDNTRLEDLFEEVPKPTWWDTPRQPASE